MSQQRAETIFRRLNAYTPLTEADFEIAWPHFGTKHARKGDVFNQVGTVCKYLAFIQKGLYRIYKTDVKTGVEQNLYFFREEEFLVSIRSFLTQTGCEYTIEALEDSEIVQISHHDLLQVYAKSHAWERFGRKLAEQHFLFLQERTESLLTQSAEERYEALLSRFPDIMNRVPLYHIASYLGIKGPSLSRIRKKAGR